MLNAPRACEALVLAAPEWLRFGRGAADAAAPSLHERNCRAFAYRKRGVFFGVASQWGLSKPRCSFSAILHPTCLLYISLHGVLELKVMQVSSGPTKGAVFAGCEPSDAAQAHSH